MNPVYSPAPTGVPFTNPKGLGYPAGFPVGYAAAAPAYTPGVYTGANPAFSSGYAPGTPFKMSCSPNTGTVPPYSSSTNPYQAAVYPVRSTYPQHNPYAQALIPSQQQVVQPNGMPAAMYAPPIAPPRNNGVAMGMVAGTTMAMSAGTLLSTPSPAPAALAPHPVTMPTYRHAGTHSYSYVPSQW
ncbi:myelin-associated neurite-outgrowth inhibitor isoform X2 [Nerophis ophidion]|uniref:myelin-associated neurite-outgrowth inhibitor isoform X2 n=1 Tax=Nerophis ophidion TaxID=159077 RepID=UPI002ADFF462|nr:myelin-associated neurite-outgrowth inhibitor isoform X2 [Nerophis ophidion]